MVENLTVPLHAYRKRLIKGLVHFPLTIIKLSHISMEHRYYGMLGDTKGGGGVLHCFTSGSEVRGHYIFIMGHSAGEVALRSRCVNLISSGPEAESGC